MTNVLLTKELVDRAKKAFDSHETKYVSRRKLGLSRTEIRLLERHGYVEKLRSFSDRKFTHTSPSMFYIWKWVK